MSMKQQLWAAIIVSMLLALCGSLLASLLSARGYLSEQITLKNIDNANALALALNQDDVDSVKIELAAAALFDSGQYQLIRVIDPRGKLIVEKSSAQVVSDAPQWFVSLLPINAREGNAQISSGWKQIGTLTLQSESRFAYHSLWRSAVQMTMALGIACLFAGYLGSLILRRLIPPLNEVVNQAQGIMERRFTTIAPPHVPELSKLAEAMNLMVKRLQLMLQQEADRLEVLRREANFDAVTGLANRNFFMARLEQALSDPASGDLLLLLRITKLAQINQQLGRSATDELLKAVGATITKIGAMVGGANITVAGRLSGADFALICRSQNPDATCNEILDAIKAEAPRFGIDAEHFVHGGAVRFTPGTEMGMVLAQADAALATAEADGRSGVVSGDLDALQLRPRNNDEWESKLREAVANQQVRIKSFPIVDMHNRIVAHECPLRLRFSSDGDWQPARYFLPIAERLHMTSALDLATIALGIEFIKNGHLQEAVVLNLSPQSVADSEFRAQLVALISKHRDIAGQLWLEIAENGALLHLDEVSALCRELAPFRCSIGIEHFGHEFSQIGRLHQIGLHYLKIDSSFISGIDQNIGNQMFLQGVRSITRIVGLQLHAEGVTNEAELKQLGELGFDAATGPGIRSV